MVKINRISVTQPEPQNLQPRWSEWLGDVSILAPNHDKVAVLPSGYPLRRSSFTRRGMHLIVQGPNCPEIVVAKFFGGGNQTTLATGDGIEVSRQMVLLMSNLSSRVKEALSALAVSAGE